MLEINKQNIDEIVRLEKYDLEVSAKWILNARSDNARIRVPETHEERLQYINDWLSVCPRGTKAKIQEYKNYIFNLAKTKNIKLEDWHVSLLVARKVATIKRNYSADQYDLVSRVAIASKKSKKGYTYLNEITYIMDLFLSTTAKKFPKTIAVFEGKNTRNRL